MQSNLQLTEAEVDVMPWPEAVGWFDCWREWPPASEMLARIGHYLGVWEPPGPRIAPKTSTEAEVLAWAMFAKDALG